MTGQALVLGGGGVAGIAWMTGVLAGLADAGEDVTHVDLMVGTSAGATVAAQLGSGLSLDELYARQIDPGLQNTEIDPGIDMESYMESMRSAFEGSPPALEFRRRLGKLALAAHTVDEAERRAVIESRLPCLQWPSTHLKIVAVDAETGDPHVFDNSSGVDLVDAVAASCAVPGIWPAVSIGSRRYLDGGIRTSDNADYAAGFSRVVILLPLGRKHLFPAEKQFDAVVAELDADVTVITPDEASATAIGTSPLDPTTRGPAAKAGRVQGLEIGTGRLK